MKTPAIQLKEKWLHNPCPYHQAGEDCPVCDDPTCEACGNPGWACECPAKAAEEEGKDCELHVPPDNQHELGCRCQECWCPQHSFSLRRPTKPPHTWRYLRCPFCRKDEEQGLEKITGREL